jgi:predicted dehydrogenase
VYTPEGATLYRDFKSTGEAHATALKPPKTTHMAALMRHFRQCIAGAARPETGGEHGIMLMQIMDAIYKSTASGKSAEVKSDRKKVEPKIEG